MINYGSRVFRSILATSLVALSLHARAAQSPAPQQIFAFHSGLWINLHEFLYASAHGDLLDASAACVGKLDDQPAWRAAIAYYQQNVIERDLLFDAGMEGIKKSLEDEEHANSLQPEANLSAALASILQNAAPIYRRACWQRHDATNRRWIAQVSPLIAEYGAALVHDLSAAYQTPWSNEPVRVDVCVYANWAGAYTTLYPTRITISSTSAKIQGPAALEILFHEASHAIVQTLQRTITEDCKKQKLILPRGDLWHAVLFYTTGEIVRRHVNDYTPYAYRNGLWEAGWKPFIGPLEHDWQPYLDGKTSFKAAVSNLVKDTGHRNDSDSGSVP